MASSSSDMITVSPPSHTTATSSHDYKVAEANDISSAKLTMIDSLEPVETKGVGEVEVAPRKNFNTLSTLSLAATLMASWEALLSTMGAGLVSGGPTSLVYGFIIALTGNLATALSLSEPASMFPGAGGQYRYISELSSPRYRSPLAFFTGYFTLMGWTALTASAPYASANLIQGLISLSDPSYEPTRWKTTLIYMCILIMAFVFNQWFSKMLPMLEQFIMAVHILFWVGILIAVCVLPETRNSAGFVFGSEAAVNLTGWDNDGVAWCLGLLTSAYILVGYDSATHLSEEISNPRLGVPRAMVGSIVINGIMGFAILLAVLFGMPSIEQALSTGTGFPIIEIFYYITRNNTSATAAMVATIIISASFATVGLSAASSRTLWAFARDEGVPASKRLRKLGTRSRIPTNALCVITIALMLLGLLNIASTAAFGAILSLTVVSLEISYLIPTVAMLYRRIATPKQLEWGPWKMNSNLGIVANVVAIAYIVFIVPFLLLPAVMPVAGLSMNYASAVIGAVLIFATADWFLRGSKVYKGALRHME